jgi:hypothetical protein
MNELQTAWQIAAGTLPSPQQFGNSWFWAIRISGVGCAWREGEGEYVWREPDLWLSPEMADRATGLPVLIDHPDGGTLNSATLCWCNGPRICQGRGTLGRSSNLG